MSRFSRLRSKLGFWKAARLYIQMRGRAYKDIRMKGIRHPFTLRKNPFDYATFEEVLLYRNYELPRHFSAKRIIDGGGNIGLTAIFLANRFPGAQIVTIEPDSDNFNLLLSNTKPYENIIAMQAGVWSSFSELEVVDTGLGNNAFIVKEVESGVGSISGVGIHDIMEVQHWDSVDVVKLDIEGSEKIVFEKEYENWLPAVKLLFVELHDRMLPGCSKTVFKTMSQYDFSCSIAGENLLFVNNAFRPICRESELAGI